MDGGCIIVQMHFLVHHSLHTVIMYIGVISFTLSVLIYLFYFSFLFVLKQVSISMFSICFNSNILTLPLMTIPYKNDLAWLRPQHSKDIVGMLYTPLL